MGVESVIALPAGERYHAFLRRVFRKFSSDALTIPEDYAPALVLKAANDTEGSRGLSPTLIVFDITPLLPLRPHTLPDNYG